jgi:hypothetical protein
MHERELWPSENDVSCEQSSVGCAVEDWLLGTQAAPAWEAGASTLAD